MPYTPPSSSSPTTQRPTDASINGQWGHARSQSDPLVTDAESADNTGVCLSSSYLRRHRRSPTTSTLHERAQSDPNNSYSASKDVSGMVKAPSRRHFRTGSNGSVPSPPDSRKDSSDEGESSKDLLDQLGAAMVAIDIKAPSPSALQLSKHMQGPDAEALSSRLDLSLSQLKGTQDDDRGNAFSLLSDGLELNDTAEIATETPEMSDQDEESMDRPPMIRKKSGELVRPALRPSQRRPTSLPETPTYSKAVHFGPQIEEVRHFLQLDRPAALSADSSPVESYDGDTEFPFGEDSSTRRDRNFEWQARVVNFPKNLASRKATPVRLDRLYLSPDNRYLVGVAAVANLSYHKHVVARFTLDYWKTVSEVSAEYSNDIQLREEARGGYDTFNFNIDLSDHSNLDEKRMFICIRYDVNGCEFWDNNNSMNYHVDFAWKRKSKSEKEATNAKSHDRGDVLDGAGSFVASRSQSFPSLPADFVAPTGFTRSSSSRKVSTTQGGILSSSPSDAIPESSARKSPLAFGNRYNFGACLSATMQSGSAKRSGVFPTREEPSTTPGTAKVEEISSPNRRSTSRSRPEARRSGSPRPADLMSGKPDHQSAGYQELVDKYCFYGSSQPSGQTHERPTTGMSGMLEDKVLPVDARKEDSSSESSSSSSPTDEKAPKQTYFHPRTQSPNSRESDTPRSSSPVVINYPYQQPTQSPFLANSPTLTAIRG